MKPREHSLRKAAILIASLDQPTAEALLTQMGAEQAARVSAAMADLEEIDPAEQNDVVEEFCRVGPLLPEKSPPGLELDSRLEQKLGLSADRKSASTMEPAATESPPFRFLHEATAEAIAPLLEREHPQTIAVVVSHLPAPRAADVLSRLPAALQGEVVRRLGDLDEANPEILREVERGLEKWVSEQARGQRRRVAGLETIANILAAADESTQREILANLAHHDRKLAGRLGRGSDTNHHTPRTGHAQHHAAQQPIDPSPAQQIDEPVNEQDELSRWTFDDLAAQNDALLVAVVRAAGTDLAALALAGAAPQLLERIARRLARNEARALRKALAHIGPTRLSDVEQAQQELADMAAALARNGQVPATTKDRLIAVA